jgi:uncharacterized protein (AIM24 family)
MSQDFTTTGHPHQQLARQPDNDGSVMAAFERLEEAELSRYCRSISVDGVIAQTVSIEFEQGQTLWAARGSLLAYDEGIDWKLKVPGGVGKAASRMLSGEGASLTHVTAKRPGASAVIGSNEAGRLATWDLSQGPIVCAPGSFVAALGDVDIQVTTAKRAGAAFFGGAGLFLQRLSGNGIAVVHGSGDFVERELAPGEKLLVSTGNLSVFSGGVDYNIRGVGGCFKSLFGGEGLFMTELTGPGWVMLQTMKQRQGGQNNS